MTTLSKNRLSLIHVISGIFITISLLVVVLSWMSESALERIEGQFTTLSEQALPMASTNATLTQNILEQVKRLSYGAQSENEPELAQLTNQLAELSAKSSELTAQLFQNASQFPGAISDKQQTELQTNIDQLQALSREILAMQSQRLKLQKEIEQAVTGFRYGLSSIGPEMNRIASFLATDNPESTDAANRFSASASSMEGTFLMLMMQTDRDKASEQYKEMATRLAGIQLAYDDFSEWHPDVADFASLTTPYQMVEQGFADNGVLKQIMVRLELMLDQQSKIQQAASQANYTISLLNTISATAQQLIGESQDVVASTMTMASRTLLFSGAVTVFIIMLSWLFLRRWINLGLVNISGHLNRLTEHDFTRQVDALGPKELCLVSEQLNQVILSTRESIQTVTRNCETLYQTAELSHDAAEHTNSSLAKQNDALSAMITTVTELEASIREIAQVTNESYQESQHAADHSSSGVRAVDHNRQRLMQLESSLDANEQSMQELDKRVKQIREMVDLIAGIADNTNLLALNAAIEAARAGEQGRGFAVVADEVRKLASDTSEHTSNIRDRMNLLIKAAEQSRQAVEESRQEMASALESSDQVQHTFESIETAVAHIRLRVEQITVATEQQERATADVSRAISQISEQGDHTKLQLEAMVESSQQVADIAGDQQTMLHKYQVEAV